MPMAAALCAHPRKDQASRDSIGSVPAEVGFGVHRTEFRMNIAYVLLGVAIVAEVIATSALKASEGFTRLGPSLLVALGYGIAFYSLSLVMKSIPVGVTYAIWSGVGIVLISLVGWLVLKQPLDLPAVLGMALIVAGVIVIQLFSKTAAH
jgi:small multidrug resistance pump